MGHLLGSAAGVETFWYRNLLWRSPGNAAPGLPHRNRTAGLLWAGRPPTGQSMSPFGAEGGALIGGGDYGA